PGDALASETALETFESLGDRFGLIKCLSTNGLLLFEYAERLKKSGVTAVTVTVNAVDKSILTKIISSVTYKNRIYTGEEGAEILINNQLSGIRAAGAFAAVKVNTVLIPGVNDGHIGAIAEAAANAGASLMNIIPLIPAGEFRNLKPPDCEMLINARAEAEKILPVFRHCMRCRADACGIPGISDFSYKLYDSESSETFSHG
ncbi:MAG: radical SAM protein, partial [Clostridiales bacterium]|nr:radical SAM protein [Clostridiales bacterium]